jgi:hypothetical protein
LRKSLTKQLVAAYIAFTGKEKKLGLLGKTFAVGWLVPPMTSR